MAYEALGINPTGHAIVGDQSEAAHRYLQSTLLAAGPWQTIGKDTPRTRLNFTYSLEDCFLNLTVSEAGLRQADESIQSVVLFAGNFNYDLGGTSPEERLALLHKGLDRWLDDLTLYRDLINQNFLAQSHTTAQPALIPAFA